MVCFGLAMRHVCQTRQLLWLAACAEARRRQPGHASQQAVRRQTVDVEDDDICYFDTCWAAASAWQVAAATGSLAASVICMQHFASKLTTQPAAAMHISFGSCNWRYYDDDDDDGQRHDADDDGPAERLVKLTNITFSTPHVAAGQTTKAYDRKERERESER